MPEVGRIVLDVLKPHHFVRPVLFAVLLGLVLEVPAVAQTAPEEAAPDLDQTVRYLIDYVARSKLTFLRNGSAHPGAEAAAHIHDKYRHFRRKIRTPEDFIERCASKSLLTGEPYLVIDDEGKTMLTEDWLRAALAEYRRRKSMPDTPGAGMPANLVPGE